MSLKCPDSHKLYILNITMGRSGCAGRPNCCPNNTECMVDAIMNHLEYVRLQCNGKDMCSIHLINLWCYSPDAGITDYESVHYGCNNPGELTLN